MLRAWCLACLLLVCSDMHSINSRSEREDSIESGICGGSIGHVKPGLSNFVVAFCCNQLQANMDDVDDLRVEMTNMNGQ